MTECWSLGAVGLAYLSMIGLAYLSMIGLEQV